MDKEEKNLTGIFNTKTIIQAGGILVALFTLFVLYKVLTNDLPHLERAINRQTDTFGEVLRENTKAIEGNTKILEIIERRLK